MMWRRSLSSILLAGGQALGLVLLFVCPAAAWLNPTRDTIEAGNTLYNQGKYEDAIGKYGEILVDEPEAPLPNYNMGTANYKAGKYAEAIASFARVKVGENEPKRLAKIAYNAGNAQYQLAAAAESEKPEDALKAYAAALVAYRRALGVDPSDRDAKFNYELVTKKIEDLKKKLEEQKQKQDQQPQDQKDQQEKQDQDKQEHQPEDQEKKDEQQPGDPQEDKKDQQEQGQPQDKGEDEKQEQEQQQAGGDEQKPEDEQQPQDAQQADGATDGDKKNEKMSKSEAASIVDAAKNEELQPEDFARRMKGAGVADAAEDW